ncbi:MFS transporter [Glutamicibacter sp. 287]|uniref:MFS transporter n=1 Tax=unclassified Glutamicibacter TaxID=2627139 RepID=UPI000BB70BFA|nr:MFS transporter [Glutamicibacter sp. BW80]PCC29005.1 MFS transporter [Glutamicibacter sp. BW80]
MLWVIAGIAILALSLRAPIISPTAAITDIQSDTGLSAAGAGLLTGLPVLLFAIATPLATGTIRRFGAEATVILCLVGVLIGTIIRSLGSAPLLLTGTVLIGAAITLGNIVVPVIIRRDVPWRRAPAATGVYSAAMNVGSMVTLLGTAPLAAAFGWRLAIAAWTVVTALGLVFWLVLLRMRRAGAKPAELPAEPAPKRPTSQADAAMLVAARSRNRKVTALLVFGFCGQSAAYYATTTWLPLLLAETVGLSLASSAASASLFQIAAVVGALGVPLLAARTGPWVPALVVAICWIALPLGLLAAPEAYIAFSVIGGVAQGGGFTAIFSLIPRITSTNAQAASASARIQGGGYVAATIAPPLAGWLNTTTGGWNAPLALVLAATLAFTIGTLSAVRLVARG